MTEDVLVSDPVTPLLTQPVRDLPPYVTVPKLDREINPRMTDGASIDPNLPLKSGIDPLLVVQASAPDASPDGFGTPIHNFEGAGYQFVNPPDTNGDVGTDHFIQMVNATVVSIYNKTTGTLLQRFDLTDLGGCATDIGDPVVIFDPMADRWLLSEFGPGSSVCTFVSQTPDPQGAYYAYQFNMSSLPDYPKFGVWPDAYYMTTNELGSMSGVHALDRAAMLAGLPATYQRFLIPDLPGFGFNAATPADLDGPIQPPAGAPGIIMRHRDTELHGPAGYPNEDYLEMWAFHVDWTAPVNSSLTQLPNIAVTEFSSAICAVQLHAAIGMPGVPQCSGSALDPLSEVIMFRLAYRNFGDHQTLAGNFVTDVDGNDLAGIRWFELRSTPGGAWGLYQEGTYSPDSTNRWMGGIAMDSMGNIALGYNVSSFNGVYPGIRYAGRRVYDPLGTLPQGEFTLIDGAANNGSSRYGDYSNMVVDPVDDCTFWFTGEYNPASQWSTRIGAFRFDACGSAGFALNVVPESQQICVSSNATYTVNTFGFGGFAGDVALAAANHPGSATFTPNPVTPPGTSSLVISGASAGDYLIDVVGASTINPALLFSTTVALDVQGAAPDAPSLTSPSNSAINVSLSPTFMWNPVPGATAYSIEVATDAGFTNVVASASGIGSTSYALDVTLDTATTYFWRVRADNACGAGAYSAVWSFLTEAAPGDCGYGTSPNILYETGFENGADGWTSSGTGNTWAIASTHPNSGASHFHATVPPFSDQRLVSPAVVIPTGQNPVTLKFWHQPDLEPFGLNGCYDGGILEVSTDGGSSWTQVPNAELLIGQYRPTVIPGTNGNPLAGLQAWCGVTEYINTIADISAYAGQGVQFRLRLGSDSEYGGPGWYVDDVTVQSCQTPTAVTLSGVDAGAAQSPLPVAGLPLGAVAAAGMVSVALAAGYLARRRS